MSDDLEGSPGAEAEAGKKKSSLLSWAVIAFVSGLIGFVTIIPGKRNHITEFPSLDAILRREALFLGLPILAAIFFHFFNKYWNGKGRE